MASSSSGLEPRPLGLPLAALIGVLVAARLLFFLVPFVLPDSAWPSGTRAVVKADISRYQQIATTPGTPYRDFEVEYPPVALGVIELLHGPTAGATAVGIGIMSLVLDLVVAALLFLYAGTEVAVAYLLVGTPIALFSLFRVDLLSVALALLAVVMVSEGHQRTGGVLLTVGVFTKIWPIFIAPLFVVRRRLKGLAWWAGTTAASAVAWIAWFGWRGPLQVLSFRGARGWEIESLVGSIVWTVTSERPHLEAGAPRVGAAP